MFTRLLIATTNRHKFSEYQYFFRSQRFQLLSLLDLSQSFPAPAETAKTYKQNALLKAKYYHAKTGLPVLADDSGLEIYRLNRFPGLLSARFAKGDFPTACNQLLSRLKHTPVSKRQARFVCALAFVDKDLVKVVQGQVHGRINLTYAGTHGFGYDPIFYYHPYRQTFGQAGKKKKHLVSHRSRAVNKFLKSLHLK